MCVNINTFTLKEYHPMQSFSRTPHCLVCGKSLLSKRADSTTCSPSCRTKKSRALRKDTNWLNHLSIRQSRCLDELERIQDFMTLTPLYKTLPADALINAGNIHGEHVARLFLNLLADILESYAIANIGGQSDAG